MSGRASRVAAAGRIFELSLGEMLWSRRTIFMAMVTAAPIAIGAAARLLDDAGRLGIDVEGVQVSGTVLFGLMIWVLYLRFIVPVLGVFYGTALIADEVDDKTITYLFTRPIPRGSVLLGKYLAYLVCTVLVVLPSVVVVYLLVVPIRGQLGDSFVPLLLDLAILATGLAVYGALFGLVGAALKRPLVVGLAFVMGWEPTVLVVPGYVRRLTVAHYLQGLVPHAMPQAGTLDLLQSIFREAPSTGSSLGWLAAILGLSLLLGVVVVERREYTVDQ